MKEVKRGSCQAESPSLRGRQGFYLADYLTSADQEIPD